MMGWIGVVGVSPTGVWRGERIPAPALLLRKPCVYLPGVESVVCKRLPELTRLEL